ncbi:phage protein [Clostridioides difficile]|nr:phage major capsid protein [Clostridioides difficile]VIB52314.1 phage protein [Clostridioides difficile]VIH13643.1 phage protein [Clostridioides difficile]HAU5354580.1 phage major capsid protein [Clostridioides difficile]HBF6604943.1 phage major capsid protein [Clostridioides difficile]
MTREEYFKKRQEMIDEAQKLLDDEIGEEGTGEEKTEEAEKIANKIKALDEEYERNVKARANLRALQDDFKVDHAIFNLTNNKGKIEGIGDTIIEDEQEKYENAWIKKMQNRTLDLNENEVLSKVNMKYKNEIRTTNSDAILIPETISKGIWTEIENLYPLFGDTSPTFVKGDFVIIKEENSGDDASWYDEKTTIKEDGYTLGEITLKGCELAKDITVSFKIENMANEDFIPYISKLLAEKMGAALAKAIYSGKGKPGSRESFVAEPRGIKTALMAEVEKSQIIEYTDSIGYSDLTKLMAVLGKWGNGACIYANNTTIWTQLAEIKDSMGRPLFIPDMVNTEGVGRILGKVVKADDSINDGEIIAGNVSRGYAININKDVALDSQRDKKKRTIDFISYCIVDGDVISNKAFGMIVKKASEVSE